MNWLDEYEAISGIQSITVWQYISKKVYLCETLIKSISELLLVCMIELTGLTAE